MLVEKGGLACVYCNGILFTDASVSVEAEGIAVHNK